MKIALRCVAAFLISLPLVGQDNHQLRPDASLLDEINHIKAIDNHSHPPALDNGASRTTIRRVALRSVGAHGQRADVPPGQSRLHPGVERDVRLQVRRLHA